LRVTRKLGAGQLDANLPGAVARADEHGHVPLVVGEVEAHAVLVGLLVAAHTHFRDDSVRGADVGLEHLAPSHLHLGGVDGPALPDAERVARALRERQRAQPVERREEVERAGRDDQVATPRERRVAERRVVILRHVLYARALADGLPRVVGESVGGIDDGGVGVVERVERGRDDADGLDMGAQLDTLAPVELPAPDDLCLDVGGRGEVREGDRVGQALADAVGRLRERCVRRIGANLPTHRGRAQTQSRDYRRQPNPRP
jgi:hypothetical protein